ncbi:MAG: TIGR02147 family protein [Bdellovibrionales bacterium]
MIYEYNDYRNYLKASLAIRIAKNPRYSLRTFAKHLGLAPATLSMILSGKKNLSFNRSLQVAERLDLNSKEQVYFSQLVYLKGSSSIESKKQVLNQMRDTGNSRSAEHIAIDQFELISDWCHYAILMLTEVHSFKFTVANVARRLSLNKFVAETAIERLQKLGLLEKVKEGQYRRIKGDIIVQSNDMNLAFRKYHRQLLEKASLSLETQPPKDRITASEVIAMSKSDLKEVNKLMEQFLNQVIELTKKSKNKTDVYHLGVQAFNLTDKESP